MCVVHHCSLTWWSGFSPGAFVAQPFRLDAHDHQFSFKDCFFNDLLIPAFLEVLAVVGLESRIVLVVFHCTTFVA